jgi:hypothetical protein
VLENHPRRRYLPGASARSSAATAAAIFVALHLRPLDDAEVEAVTRKRRGRRIQAFFAYDNRERAVDHDFKKRMAARGKFYPMAEGQQEMPAIAAALLKYKKHEWIIVAFARGQTVDLMWLNKGPHKFGVSSLLPDAAIADRCWAGGYDAVLLFHNHPNSRPQYLDMSQPSPRDVATADLLGGYLDDRDVALAEFVCERGLPYRYFWSAPDALYPLTVTEEQVSARNGRSPAGNLWLHSERIFSGKV